MDLETINYSVRDGVAHVRFARADGANTVNPNSRAIFAMSCSRLSGIKKAKQCR